MSRENVEVVKDLADAYKARNSELAQPRLVGSRCH
jgi:hypothetical protein